MQSQSWVWDVALEFPFGSLLFSCLLVVTPCDALLIATFVWPLVWLLLLILEATNALRTCMPLGCGSVVLQPTPIVVLPRAFMSLRFQSAGIKFRTETYLQERSSWNVL